MTGTTAQAPANTSARPAGWTAYYDAVPDRPPSRTLLAALERFEAEPSGATERIAADLGCGDGRDTVELLRRGWRVVAYDADADGVGRLKRRALPEYADRLEVATGRHGEVSWPSVDLVNASLTLGWCAAEAFPGVWEHIVSSLGPGGRFAGQLFGERDSGGGFPTTTRLSRATIDQLLEPFNVELFREEEVESLTPFGIMKHRHIYDVVARKRA